MLDVLEERIAELRKARLAREAFTSSKRDSLTRSGKSPVGDGAGGGFGGAWSPSTRGRSSFLQRFDPCNLDLRRLYGGRRVRKEDLERVAQAPWKVRLWTTMDEPGSSTTAAAIAILVLVLIVYSTTTFCLETLHGYYNPHLDSTDFFYISEAVCIAIFTLEAVLRLVSCPDIREYLSAPMNLIDLIAIMPFYVEVLSNAVAGGDSEVPGLAVFRVVRLVRVFRLLKVSKDSINLFAETMSQSIKPLNMLFMLVSIAIVVCASLMYFIERGRFNVEMKYWERPYTYLCEVTIVAEGGKKFGPDATYSRLAGGNTCERSGVADDGSWAKFKCSYPYKKDSGCTTMYEQSPFSSIVSTFWWAWVTMTTVGYGDHYPTTLIGKIFGMVVMFFGVLVIALPITVIGSNFATAYNREQAALESNMKAEQAAERRKALEQNAAASFNSRFSGSPVGSAERSAESFSGDFDDIHNTFETSIDDSAPEEASP